MNRRGLLIGLVGATGAVATIAFGQKPNAAKPQDKFAVANQHVKELLLLMDADKNGKISRQEWMTFMEAEFNRLDKDGSGELDLKELVGSRIASSQAG